MYTGSLPPATIYSTWIENIEIRSADDGLPVDLTVLSEIQLNLMDRVTKFVELSVKKSSGAITLPAAGVLQWRVEVSDMGTLSSKFYEAVLLLTESDNTVTTLILGTVSIME